MSISLRESIGRRIVALYVDIVSCLSFNDTFTIPGHTVDADEIFYCVQAKWEERNLDGLRNCWCWACKPRRAVDFHK